MHNAFYKINFIESTKNELDKFSPKSILIIMVLLLFIFSITINIITIYHVNQIYKIIVIITREFRFGWNYLEILFWMELPGNYLCWSFRHTSCRYHLYLTIPLWNFSQLFGFGFFFIIYRLLNC